MPKYYLSLNLRNEVKRRISLYESIKENLKDAEAELAELRKMNPNVKAKGSGDTRHSAIKVDEICNDMIVNMADRKDKLITDIAVYKAIISDYKRGMKLLTPEEQKVLELRYHDNQKQSAIALLMNIDRKTVYNYEISGLQKMEGEIMIY